MPATSDEVELVDRQDVEGVGERDRREDGGPTEVADDQDRAAPESIDPHAGRQREEDEGEELDRPEEADLERVRLEHQDRHERDRQHAHLRAELADRLSRPELEEVGMAPEAGDRRRLGHGRSL
jgi:hypothetical protein